ncbi:MAG: hypothetical protein BM564_03500 [Bacteroidetes bacterium MedPE-SWsnd-G2]|nr:MAG: hypothetical protein BM564_03500 [Bacteroidetes bacterium MedPE-SWsnd-G2]
MRYLVILYIFILSITSNAQTFRIQSIDSILNSYGIQGFSPGFTVGIVHEDNLLYHGYRGYMNLEYNLPFNDSTVISLASVTKQFTSACIAILEKRGKLSIEDDVRTYIPELKDYGSIIKIKHLLNHTSGIRNHNVLLNLMGFDYNHEGYTNKSIQKLMFQQEGVNNKPGEKMLYSNTNYVLLALIIERVSNESLPEFAKSNLFEPLQMNSTFYKSNLNAIIKNRSYPYYYHNGSHYQRKSLTHCIGAGGIKTTIRDMEKWAQVYLDNTHKLHYLGLFTTQTETLNNNEQMTHGKGMFTSNYNGLKTYNHNGRDIGMRSQFLIIPDLNLAIFVYSNTDEINAVDLSYSLLNLWIPEQSKSEVPKNAQTFSSKNLIKFTGDFQELNSDLRMKMFVENDTLKALSSFGRNPIPLIRESKTSFSRKNNPSVKYEYILHNQTAELLNVDFGGAQFYFEKVTLSGNPNSNVSDFVGSYYSKELNVTYDLKVEDNKLVLNYPNSNNIILNEGEQDVFGSNRRTKYEFIRNNKGQVNRFLVSSEGTVKDILFHKILR